jgi:hypothetical protein
MSRGGDSITALHGVLGKSASCPDREGCKNNERVSEF